MGNGNPSKKGGGRDLVIESRHLLGMFLGVVVLCGVFFTLGYVMGRTQYETSVGAVAAASRDQVPEPEPFKVETNAGVPVPAPSDWTFPSAAGPKKAPEPLRPPRKKAPELARAASFASSGPSSLSAAKSAVRTVSRPPAKPPLIPRGAFVLQVAALTREADALALAEALQKKEYPAFVLTPAGGNLYRVQVGPYADAASADSARRALEREGFKTITKR